MRRSRNVFVWERAGVIFNCVLYPNLMWWRVIAIKIASNSKSYIDTILLWAQDISGLAFVALLFSLLSLNDGFVLLRCESMDFRKRISRRCISVPSHQRDPSSWRGWQTMIFRYAVTRYLSINSACRWFSCER